MDVVIPDEQERDLFWVRDEGEPAGRLSPRNARNKEKVKELGLTLIHGLKDAS